MKAQEQYMREILDGQTYTVDPRHEAAFREMLLGKKRRRRFTALFFILAGLAVASVVLLTQINPGESHASTQPAQVESPEADQRMPASTDSNDAGTDDHAHESGSAGQMDAEQDSEFAATVASEPQAMMTGNTKQENGSRNAQRDRQDASANTVPSATHANASDSATSGGANDTQPDAFSSDPDKEISASQSFENVPSGDDAVLQNQNQLAQEDKVTHGVGAPSQVDAQEANSEETPIQSSSTETQKSDTEIIIPAGKQMPDKRIAFGLAGMWYPAGLGMNASDIAVGHGIQLGGYVTYRMTPRLALRTDAGFGVLDGGFQFMKESETEVYGFSVLTIHDRMDVERLYSGYLASEVGWIAGKHTITAGLHGQFFYGAKGDIRREEIATDAPGPKETVSENVWVSIPDLQRFALHGALGLRSKVASRIELAAAVRIPILKPVQLSPGAKAFEYTIRSPGISPMISVSYQISQQ